MYVTGPDGRHYLKHHLLDMGSTFGSNNLMPHMPMDRFAIEGGEVRFADLAVAGKLEEGGQYQCRLLDEKGKPLGSPRVLEETRLEIEGELAPERYYGYELRTQRPGQQSWSKYTRVYFYKWEEGRHQLVRVEREE
ncbi:MAG: hypothetical protein HYW07_15725 [Candidatus Latescibacteria bacterium]|nr:hypothetical protein [Candidatus Latescibacterota bacterium]